MKEKGNEWISISDLMAGVMAVVMLLLVVSVLQNQFSELKRQEELNKGLVSEQEKLSTLLQGMQSALGGQGSGLVSFDLANERITLGDSIFSRGSACVTAEARRELSLLSARLSGFMTSSPHARVVVEGHTDNIQVSRPVTDFARFCTVYDDNFTLSAARAREARKLLIEALNPEQARRVIVAGYGDSQPLPDRDPADEGNRRVEVQFLNKPSA
ncbi:OmpA family protein [Pseudomonas luteola]|uniref:OmpA/MotB family protein n=1 Tax=Pseudomonas luteola TaxID=47886 RepID=UPI000F7788EA|nr:OmpA family protein [Pseudomonas luteola]RRW39536.1 OmpA family protein [Pseudomonas luteola]